jgi:predicted amidohydrolase YtcJ
MRHLLLAVSLAITPAVLAQSAGPDLIITNAKVFTADPNAPWAQAVAITGDHISAVGTSDQVRSIAVESTKRIDARGSVIIPGLNVAHEDVCITPALGIATAADATAADVHAAVANLADESATDTWISGILGTGALNDLTFTTAMLDKTSQGHRVILVSADRRAVMPNSAAMATLHINDSRDPLGGAWQHDATGRSTGKALDYAGRNILRRWSEETSEEDAIRTLQGWGENATRLGITTIQVVSCMPFSRFERLVRHASLPIRVRIINAPGTNSGGRNVDELREMPKPAGGRAMLDVSGIEWSANLPSGEIASILKEGADANQQLLFDVGDTKTAALLDAMKSADVKTRRVRLEERHVSAAEAAVATKVDLHDLGVVVVDPRAPKTLLKSGVPIAFGPLPYDTIEAAISDPKEAITREQALDAYTRGAAYAEFAESDKGILAPGKVADLAVLSQNIFEISPSRIPETTSVLTIIGGRVAYDAHLLTPEPTKSKSQ